MQTNSGFQFHFHPVFEDHFKAFTISIVHCH